MQEAHMIANYHTHTWRCNHAEGKEEDYVLNGIKRGLEILGFSDHSPYIFPGDYHSTFRMRMDQLDDYIETVLGLRKQFQSEIQIPLGLEIEFYPELLPKLLPILRDRPIDYLLLGQHYLGNEINEHYNGHVTADSSLLKRYCYQTMEAMNTGLFTYFAHPDLFHYAGDAETYRKFMRQMCKEAISCHMPLEFNLLGLELGRNYPDPTFWQIAAEEGCSVILGCDAHKPQALLNLSLEQKALQMLEDLGLKRIDKVELRRI